LEDALARQTEPAETPEETIQDLVELYGDNVDEP
jgi:hypothetical protein